MLYALTYSVFLRMQSIPNPKEIFTIAFVIVSIEMELMNKKCKLSKEEKRN